MNVPTETEKTVFSENFLVKNESWYIGIERSENNKFLTVVLYGDRINSPLTACVLIKVISHINEKNTIVEQSSFDFGSGDDNWGWPSFTSWSKLEDPKYGYTKDAKITFEIDVTVI